MPTVAEDNVISVQSEQLVFDGIQLIVSITHLCKPKALERFCILEQRLYGASSGPC